MSKKTESKVEIIELSSNKNLIELKNNIFVTRSKSEKLKSKIEEQHKFFSQLEDYNKLKDEYYQLLENTLKNWEIIKLSSNKDLIELKNNIFVTRSKCENLMNKINPKMLPDDGLSQNLISLKKIEDAIISSIDI